MRPPVVSKPIKEWDIRRTTAHDRRGGRAPEKKSVGVVFVRRGDPRVLEFSATVSRREETLLFLELMAAFSTSEGIRKDTGAISWLSWPNKVTIDEMVVAKTSASSAVVQGEPGLAEVSFRVNLLRVDEEGATSLFEKVGVEVDPELLTAKILESLSWMQFGWEHGMHAHLLQRVRSMAETIGREVFVIGRRNEKRAGRVDDVDGSGRLRVRLDSGRVVTLTRSDELILR